MDANEIAKLIKANVEPKISFAKLYEDWLDMPAEHTIDVGVEIEAIVGRRRGRYILPFENNDSDGYIMHTLLSRMKKKVFRDWYPHQLEIRAGPGKADKVVEELKATIAEVNTILRSFKCGLLFRSMFDNIPQTCGMHVHADVSILKDNLASLERMMAVSYLPILISYDLHRDVESKHIRLQTNRFVRHVSSLSDALNKDRDLHISGARPVSEGRHRLEKPITWETRVYDTSTPEQMYHAILMHSHILTKSFEFLKEKEIITPKQLFANAIRYRGKFVGNEVVERNYHKALATFINWTPLNSEIAIRLNWMHSLDVFSRAMIKEIDGEDELIYQIYPYNKWRLPVVEDNVINIITHELGKLTNEQNGLMIRSNSGVLHPLDRENWFKYYIFASGSYHFIQAAASHITWSTKVLNTPSTKHLDDNIHHPSSSPIPDKELSIVRQELESTIKEGFVDLVSKPAFEAINQLYSGDRRAQCPL